MDSDNNNNNNNKDRGKPVPFRDHVLKQSCPYVFNHLPLQRHPARGNVKVMAPLPPSPPPIPVETHPNRASGQLVAPYQQRELPDPNRLAPEDAYYVPSPLTTTVDLPDSRPKEVRKIRGEYGRRRRRKGAWKKLLWVKQSCMFACPDCLRDKKKKKKDRCRRIDN